MLQRGEASGELRCCQPGSHLVEQLNRVAFMQHAFHQHGAVHASHALVRFRNGLQYGRRFFRSIGIECDHHATRITLQNGDGYF